MVLVELAVVLDVLLVMELADLHAGVLLLTVEAFFVKVFWVLPELSALQTVERHFDQLGG